MCRVWALAWALVISALFNIMCMGTDTRHIQTLSDQIGAENFSYYRLQRAGSLRLELTSLLGDVDVYISSEIEHPDYTNYELKSETCGVDIISISASMPRPVYISLFGHPNYLLSKYRLSIYDVDEPIVEDYEALVDKYERYYYEEMEGTTTPDEHHKQERSSKSSSRDRESFEQKAEDDLPLWWKILLGILEFGIEVIL